MALRSLLIVLFLCASIAPLQAQTPKTLLWKITGKNFSKPSYLYGTMHSGDKRVYFLGDSVYSSLRSCDGFAIEIDPGEYIDTLLNSMENKELDVSYKEAVENDLVRKDAQYYKRRQKEYDSVLAKMRQRYRDISPKDMRRLERAYRRRDKNDMNTMLDLYLFDLAKKQGKVVSGIEDISDQTSLKDELGNTFDPDEFLKTQRKKYADVMEWMIVNYAAEELDQIHEFSKMGDTKRQLSLVLYNRNDKMSRRIDSLGSIRSTFCAVGAAHLPGDSGVIDLLRKRGFTVTPVFSSKKIEPGDIKVAHQMDALINITDSDSNYVVQMPGKPTLITGITDKLNLRTYKELSNEIMLMCGVYEDGNISKTIDKHLTEIKNYFNYYDIKLYKTAKIKRQELDGYDMNFKGRSAYIRMQLFHNKGKLYMFAVGSSDRDSVNSARCEKFLNTYRMILHKTGTEIASYTFADPGKAFSVAMPSQPKIENIRGDATYTKEDVTFFSSVDNRKKINYLVLLKEPFKGYFVDFDSSIIVQTVNELKKDIRETDLAQENVLLDGRPALKVRIKGQLDGKSLIIYMVLAMRHNRLYNLTARGLAVPENEILFENYFNSFRFLPYSEKPFQKYTGGDDLFTVMSPSPIQLFENRSIEKGKNKSFAKSNRTDYYAFDSSTAMSYGITAIKLGKYYWADGENTFLNEYPRAYFNELLAVNNIHNNDSLVYNKPVINGKINGQELLIKSLFNNSYTRVRIMHYADSVFVIILKGDKELLENKNADLFFNSFRFTNENFRSDIFESKSQILVGDLQSDDKNLRLDAAETLNRGFKFPVQDLPVLLKALLYDYSSDKNNPGPIPLLLAQVISAHTNKDVLEFIKANYATLKGKREDLRILMINMLSAYDNTEAYQVLKNLLMNDPAVPASYEIAMNNFRYLPARSASLLPEIAIKLKDDDLAPVTCELINMLIDSNKIQYNSIKAYEDDILRLSKKVLKVYRDNFNESFYWPHASAAVEMLARINSKQARSVLKDLMELQNRNLNLFIIVALIKNDQPVSSEIIDRQAEKPASRIELYDELLKIGKTSFFKGEYANQRSFAEAFATLYLDNEIPGSKTKYLEIAKIKDTIVNNVRSRFYIFKATYQQGRYEESFTCITGPFSTDVSRFSIKEGDERFVLYRKKFDPKLTDVVFSDFIEKVNKIKKVN